MSAHHTHQEITKRLKEISEQLSKGDLSEEELKEFETLSRRLYERAVVLNYKAKEAHVYSKSVSDELVKEEAPSEQQEKKKEETPVQKEEPEATEKESVENGEIAFDFSSDSEEEAASSISQTEQEEVIQKDEVEEEPKSTEEPLQQKQASETITEPESKGGIPEEKISSFFERFTQVHDDSLMSKLGASKLDSLKGAFGLNDKMQIISELFEGSSEAFNETIEKLDTQESNEKARLYLSEIAVKQNWDPENPVVEDFVRILDRRYAE